MAYRLKLREPLQKGVRRVGLEQIEGALQRLEAPGDIAVAIHDARRCMKRIRALLRLVRPGLGEPVFRRENARFREIARLLAGARDLHVLQQTVAKLEARHGLDGHDDTFTLRRALGRARRNAEGGFDQDNVGKARAMLRKAERKFARLKLDPAGFSPIREGLFKGYHGCRQAFRAAYAAPSDEAFHEWRKSVQQHWRHMLLLSLAWPEVLTARAQAAREISDILGEDHDLALLLAFLNSETDPPVPFREISRIKALCRSRQAELRAQARPHGNRLLAEGTKGLQRRIETYWRAAVDISDSQKGDGEARRSNRWPDQVHRV
jgi:CHAD domain-containing protein